MQIMLKRIYDLYDKEDGYRILVDRLWPRGVSKEKAHIDLWLKDISPSTELRKWFGHDPDKWEEFKRKYRKELSKNSSAVSKLTEIANQNTITLLYAAKDTDHNEAKAIKEYIETKRLN